MPGKFARSAPSQVASQPVATPPAWGGFSHVIRSRSTTPDAVTPEGGAGFLRDPKSELYLLAVTNMVGEATFYESADSRDERFERLVRQVALEDPAWIARFIPYLRNRLNMRSAALVMAAEFTHAWLNGPGMFVGTIAAGPRPDIAAVIDSAIVRADEPAEFVAYWRSRHGAVRVQGETGEVLPRLAHLPKPVKRGLARAVRRLYNERNALKWDSSASTVRMGDVIQLVHPTPAAEWQSALFRYLIDVRHNRDYPGQRPGVDSLDQLGLSTLHARARLEAVPIDKRRSLIDGSMEPNVTPNPLLADAGMTWESLSGWLQGPMDAKAWEAIIPSMGYMALLRNLRNFDEAKISPAARGRVKDKLADPLEVAGSRQLPLRFYAAYKHVKSLHWGGVLEGALDLTLQNIPSLPGRTLVMLDVSKSMENKLSGKSDLTREEAAGIFAGALALRAEKADLYGFTDQPYRIVVSPGGSVLRIVEASRILPHSGTKTWDCIKAVLKPEHDRVVILTDEASEDVGRGQYGADQSELRPDQVVPDSLPVYTFNLAGYRVGHAPAGTGNRHTFGGLTDAGFEAIASLEARRSSGWSFLEATA